MTEPPQPGLQPLSHLKAGPTTSSSKSTTLHAPNQPPVTRPSSRLRLTRPSGKEELDVTSDKATLALIRRVLCPQASSHGASSPQPMEDLLPPLTSSNDVDRQLYAFLAIIVKEFVYSWYSKITPDQALVNEVLQVVAHCTRALEQRIRQIDVAQLILDEIPALVEAHIVSYRLAKQQSLLSGLSTSHRTLYHELNPHPGLSPDPDPVDPDTVTAQAENEALYRHLLATGTLAVLLPTEDLENGGLRTLVGDVLADLILGREVAGRICEGWFFWEVITKLATEPTRRQKNQIKSKNRDGTATSQLERFGLLSKQEKSANSPAAHSRFASWVWNVLQSIYFGFLALRFVATGLFRVAYKPRRKSQDGVGASFPTTTSNSQKQAHESPLSSFGSANKRPVLDYRLCSMISQLLAISEKTPWLSGMLALSQHLILAGPGRIGSTDGVLDRFLRETIDEYILPPTLLPNLLLVTRSTLFPANARPSSLGVPMKTGASVPTPLVSVQPPTSSGNPIANATPTAPVVEGAIVVVNATESSDQSHNAGNNNRNNINVGGSGVDHLASAGFAPSAVLPFAVDGTSPPSADPTISENTSGRSKSEIAAIKRRCAASLLAVIPHSVARTFFGLPPFPNDDGTCSAASAATTSSPDLTNISTTPSSTSERSGVQPGSSPERTSTGSQTAHVIRTKRQGDVAEQEQTNSEETNTEVDPKELYLLETIENDLLDIFADEYCNKHLIYAIIETILAKILPEMADRTISDLMEDRGVVPVAGGF